MADGLVYLYYFLPGGNEYGNEYGNEFVDREIANGNHAPRKIWPTRACQFPELLPAPGNSLHLSG